MMIIANKIKHICIDRGITQKQFAEFHGDIYQTFLNKLARNKMRFSEVERMMDELGCDIIFRDRKTGKEY